MINITCSCRYVTSKIYPNTHKYTKTSIHMYVYIYDQHYLQLPVHDTLKPRQGCLDDDLWMRTQGHVSAYGNCKCTRSALARNASHKSVFTMTSIHTHTHTHRQVQTHTHTHDTHTLFSSQRMCAQPTCLPKALC